MKPWRSVIKFGALVTTALSAVTLSAVPAEAGFLVAPIVGAFLSGFAATVVTTIVGAALSIGVSYLVNSVLSPDRPKPQGVGGVELDIRLDADVPQSLILGRAVTAGSLFYSESFGSKNQNLVEGIALADHPCEGLVKVFVDAQDESWTDTGNDIGNKLPTYTKNGTDHLHFEFYDGTQTTVDAYANTNLGAHAERPWTTDMIGRGITYARTVSRFEPELVPGPMRWKFVVDGMKLYDPRLDSTVSGGSGSHRLWDLSTHAFSQNLVVMAYNILQGIRVADADGYPQHFYGLEATFGNDKVTNGDFAADSDWTKESDWTIGSGVATKVPGGSAARLTQAQTLTAGKAYRVTFEIKRIDAGLFRPQLRGGTTVDGTNRTAVGTYSEILIAVTGNDTVGVIGNSAADGDIDNVVVEEVSTADCPPDIWMAAMNEADVTVDGEPQFHGGGEVKVSVEPLETVRELVTAMDGRFVEIGGVYKIYVGAPGASVLNITDDTLRADEEDVFRPIRPLEQRINHVSGIYTSPTDGWVPKVAPPREDADGLADDGRRVSGELDAPFIQSGKHIQRMMKEMLARARKERRHKIPLPPEAWGLEPGDYITWTSDRNGYVGKLFEVEAIEDFHDLSTTVSIIEVDANDYNWDPGTDLIAEVDGSLINTRPAPKVVDDFSVSAALHVGDDGAQRPAIVVTWTAPDDPDIVAIDVQYRRVAASTDIANDVTSDPESGQMLIFGDLRSLTDYEVRVRHRSFEGWATNWSAWAPVTTLDGRIATIDVLDNAVTTPKVDDGAITTIKIGDNAVTTPKVLDAAIVSAKINDAAVTTAKMLDAAVTALKLADAAVLEAKIATDAITAVKIASSAVTSDKINDAAVVAAKLASGSVINDKVASRTLAADRLLAKTLTMKEFAAGSFDNLVQNPGFEAGVVSPHQAVDSGGTWSVVVANMRSGDYALEYDPAGQTGLAYINLNGSAVDMEEQTACSEGDQFYAEVWVRRVGAGTSNNVRIRLIFRQKDGTLVNAPTSSLVSPAGYEKISVAGTAGAGTAFVHARIQVENDGNSPPLVFDDLYMRRMVDGGIVVDGAIATSHLGALAVTAAKVAASAIETDKIANDAVVAGKIAAAAVGTSHLEALAVTEAKVADAAVTVNKLASGAVDATKLASSISAAEIVSSLPASGNYDGRLAYLTTDHKLYRYDANAGAWTASVPATDLTGQITETQITDGAISTPKLEAGSVTTAKVAAGAITANEIAADTITAGQIAAGAVSTSELAAGAVTASEIAAGTITASEIAAGTITASEIATGTITAAEIAAGTITASEIAAGTITAAEIAANTITASEIAAGTITAAEIAAATITATEIATDAITAAKILAGAVTTVKLDAGSVTTAKLAAGAVTATEIAAGTITANEIAAATITASEIAAGAIGTTALAAEAVTADKIASRTIATEKLFVGHFDNLAQNPGFELGMEPHENFGDSNWLAVDNSANSRSGDFRLRWDTEGQTATAALYLNGNPNQIQHHPAAAEGDQFYFEAWIRGDGGAPYNSARLQLGFRDTAGSAVSTVNGTAVEPPNSSYQKITVTGTAPAGVAYVYLALQVLSSGNDGPGKFIGFDDCYARRMATGDIIVDGTIGATHIAAGAITASEIASNTITANEIAAGAITANEIAAGAITAAEIAADAVTAVKIAADAVTSAKIFAGAVTAEKIATSTITTKQLVATNFDNLIQNAGFESGVFDTWDVQSPSNGTWSVENSNARSGGYAAQFDPSGQTANAIITANGQLTGRDFHPDASEGDEFYFQAYVKKGTGTTASRIRVGIQFRDESDTSLQFDSALVTPDGTYQKLSVAGIAPAGTAYAVFRIDVLDDGGDALIHVDDSYARRKLEGAVVVDGTLTADNIKTNTITTNEIVITGSGRIQTGNLFTDAVTTASSAFTSGSTAAITTATEVQSLTFNPGGSRAILIISLTWTADNGTTSPSIDVKKDSVSIFDDEWFPLATAENETVTISLVDDSAPNANTTYSVEVSASANGVTVARRSIVGIGTKR